METQQVEVLALLEGGDACEDYMLTAVAMSKAAEGSIFPWSSMYHWMADHYVAKWAACAVPS